MCSTTPNTPNAIIHRHPPGFRCTLFDVLFIVVATLGAIFAWPILGEFSLLFPFVVGHFFLFCNVFRVRRRYELYWSCYFVMVFTFWLAVEFFGWDWMFSWWMVLIMQSPMTILLIVLEIRSPEYHGVFYGRKTQVTDSK